MKLGLGSWGRSALAVCCLAMAVASLPAQKPPSGNSVQATRSALIEKARALEARGRPDMAVQLWQQILLSEPKNADALAGEARDYKLTGNADKATDALNRLRAANPGDPNIARIESMSTQPQGEQLRQAGALAQQNKPEDAMRIFRQLYGDHPPNGDIALLYYQTLYATKTGKAAAVAGMRELAAQNPGVSEYAVALGTMLTYDARTRTEGIRILEAHPQDPDAQTALRQALIWNAANPATATQLRDYLKGHPQDQEVADLLKQDEGKLAQMHSGIARTPAEQVAFAALNANRLDEAESRLASLLGSDPTNGRVLAGMGFLRMRQRDFSAAIKYLSAAENNGYKDRTVEEALTNSRFWLTMGEATQAFDSDQFDLAQEKFRAALAINPESPDALSGLAGLLVKQQQYTQAAGVYEQLLRLRPNDPDAWRGLFVAYARAGQNDKALAAIARFPAPAKTALGRDLDYLRTVASIYQAQGNSEEAQRTLLQALALPVPDSNATLDTRLQYAGILLQAKRYFEAAEQYVAVLKVNPSHLGAWEGLIAAHHNLGQDVEAIEDVKRMPVATYETAVADADFLAQLGAIYQQANQFEVAQGLLERAEKQTVAAGKRPSLDLELQLAAIYLLRNDPSRAFELYRQVLSRNPDSGKAWLGLVTALHAAKRDSEALQEVGQIPPNVRKQLDANIDFVQVEASSYVGVGDIIHGLQFMQGVRDYYARTHQTIPPDVDVQYSWLLYNAGDDRSLYDALMRLGGRSDLTAAQRETVQGIWANWSVRRASVALDNGDYRRAVDILDAARLAFPDNGTVGKAVAGGYVVVGRAKEALAIFKTIPLQDASAADFEGAVGAALAAGDKNQAEVWLRQALERYPRDPAILTLAARYEQSRGNNERAADYYRASLAAMPAVSPADRLAHILVHPETDTRPQKAVTAADLQRLLNPENEPFAKTTKLPPLPAYGPDPYNGTAPVVFPTPSGQPASPAVNTPALQQVRPATDPKPVIVPIPSGALSPQTLSRTPVPVSSGGTGASELSVQASAPQASGTQPASRSLAAENWQGLISSLLASGHNAEALEELNKIPADVRSELENDVGFQENVASLYAAIGDMQRAQPYLARVDTYFAVHSDDAPVGLAIQRAWLLYNIKDETALYIALLHLDPRTDLTQDQQADVRKLWASWAVRRANAAMDRGNLVYGVEILQAATQDFPENVSIRRAVAGAYARIGRTTDAVALYKTIPMTDASSADFEGAISAAIAVGDMAQAETWLRRALVAYPHDAQILSLAARFEQVRGNGQRAADFLRSAVSAANSGPTLKPLQGVLAYPPSDYRAPGPGVTRYLLNPRFDTAPVQQQAPAKQEPPPLFHPQSSIPERPSLYGSSVAPPARWLTQPSKNLLPLPAGVLSAASVTAEGGGGGTVVWPLPTQASKPLTSGSDAQPHTGRVVLPRSEENVVAVPEEAPDTRGAPKAAPPTVRQTLPGLPEIPGNSGESLRAASPVMNAAAAETQARFANETDSQLRDGSAAAIHSLPAASVPPFQSDSGSAQSQITVAQYTPSAQEATTGAYSAQKQVQAAPQTTKQAAPSASPPTSAGQSQSSSAKKPPAGAAAPRRSTTTAKKTAAPSSTGESQPVSSQPEPNPPAEVAAPQPIVTAETQASAQNPSAPSESGLSDQELQERNLPPLRGPWVRTQRGAPRPNPRDVAEQQLQQIESSYSGWFGGSSNVAYRSGALGFSRLAALEDPFEVSLPVGYRARFTVVAKPVFLDSGLADGSAVITVQETTSTGTKLVTIPEPIGTLTNTDTNLPAQQNATGMGGELQFAFPTFAIAGGYTPYGFATSAFTARVMWRPGNGPFTFNASRDSVKDSQLSYAGLHDPAVGPTGAKWGGVISNQGTVQFGHGDAQSGFYFAAGGQFLSGLNVPDNRRIDGTAGAYWRTFAAPEYGTLSIGANFFAMHYDNNQNAFTYGMGGYFSPQTYFLANAPFTWQGHYETHWHYNVMGAAGVQAFQLDATPLWPLAAQKALQAANSNPILPNLTSISGNYDLRGQVAYQIGPHWFAGVYFQANNTRNYNYASGGFYVRYLFREQPSTATAPTGLFPSEGIRPFTVP